MVMLPAAALFEMLMAVTVAGKFAGVAGLVSCPKAFAATSQRTKKREALFTGARSFNCSILTPWEPESYLFFLLLVDASALRERQIVPIPSLFVLRFRRVFPSPLHKLPIQLRISAIGFQQLGVRPAFHYLSLTEHRGEVCRPSQVQLSPLRQPP